MSVSKRASYPFLGEGEAMKRTMLSRLIMASLAGVAMAASATTPTTQFTLTSTAPGGGSGGITAMGANSDAVQAVAKSVPGGGSGDIAAAVQTSKVSTLRLAGAS